MATKKDDHKNDVKQNAGLDQTETKSQAQEGPSAGSASDAGRERGQPEPSTENPSPMADSIEQEKLDQFKNNENNDETAKAA